MFCARCGKEIDNDSTFCPFCGQKTDEPVESGGGSRKPKTSAKMPGKKVVGGIAAIAVVVLIVFGISRVIRGISHRGESLPEKLFAMSWEEISEISEYDFKDMLDEEGTLYTVETIENFLFEIKGIKTKTTEPFMGGDCLYLYIPESFATMYEVRYETEEEFKAGRKQIEEVLEKSLLRNTVAFENTYGGMKVQFYPIGVSDKSLSENPDVMDNLLTLQGIDNVDEFYGEELEKLSQCYMYKFAYVAFGNQNDLSEIGYEFAFPSDKSYTNNMCVFGTTYSPMREEDLISQLALQSEYDAVSGKEMDMDRFQESVDENFVNTYLDQKASSDDYEYRHELEKELYIRLYMMEKHKFDTELNTYLKTDDEKKMWYIRNFDWDTDTGAPVDLSDYRDSSSIYCAVECNYNSDTAEYFESKLDRALYLADRDYKVDTGESFGGTDEKRFWFMQNYGYDISSGKMIEKEVVDALIAYQKYIDDNCNNKDCLLIYLDNNGIPELMDTDTYSLFTYYSGQMMKLDTSYYNLAHASYAEKTGNLYIMDGGVANHEAYYFYNLSDGVLKLIGSCDHQGYLDGSPSSNYINEEEVTEDEFYEFINQMESNSVHLPHVYYRSVLSAYDALRTTIYETNEYCIYKYELKDCILTVKADDGANADTNSFGTCQSFEFSYPVADDCVWQEGGHGYGDEAMDGSWDVAPEDIENEIRQERKIYDTAPDELQSPPGIQFRIIDDEVVAVYTSKA